MLSPKYQHYADQIRKLVEEAADLARNGDNHNTPFVSWMTTAEQILLTVFGKNSVFYDHYDDYLRGTPIWELNKPMAANYIAGILQGGLSALEGGYLHSQGLLIAAEIFDSLLQQARELNGKGYKDPAAVLARVALEDALKRLAVPEGIDENQKASKINTDLWKTGLYSKPMWRQVQAWLDTGNAAAHGEFDNYSQDDVTRLIEGVELFLATEFQV